MNLPLIDGLKEIFILVKVEYYLRVIRVIDMISPVSPIFDLIIGIILFAFFIWILISYVILSLINKKRINKCLLCGKKVKKPFNVCGNHKI